ncbi:hypothetical protein JOB18_007451 [Solea senegalensis]|uniref:Uncharacterized protein n=1 Tax=Solea senegalensis TaxID=28829 RepID=A0AAV6QZC1_SOLSE|nr:hypothetical protein JOB18_007451 [Solea senegalensis]
MGNTLSFSASTKAAAVYLYTACRCRCISKQTNTPVRQVTFRQPVLFLPQKRIIPHYAANDVKELRSLSTHLQSREVDGEEDTQLSKVSTLLFTGDIFAFNRGKQAGADCVTLCLQLAVIDSDSGTCFYFLRQRLQMSVAYKRK